MNLHSRSRGMKALAAACGLIGLLVGATGCMKLEPARNGSETASVSWSPPVLVRALVDLRVDRVGMHDIHVRTEPPIGAVVATGAVAASKGHPVALKAGTVMAFTTIRM